MKPIIGVMPLWDEDRDSLWMLPGYLEGIRQAGGLPIIFPFTEDERELDQLMALCRGFLFTGGQDIAPSLYGETLMEGLHLCEKRDRMEKLILEKALSQSKPVLGICRGIQLINACLGGSLFQDIPTQHPSDVKHQQRPPYHVPIHTVTLLKDGPLYSLLRQDMIAVNSYHHQGIKDIAPDLRPMAVAPDGLVEALYGPNHPFLWAVQWHPEFSFQSDENSRRILDSFVEAAKKE